MTLPSVIRQSAAIDAAAMPFSIESGTRVAGSFGARSGSGSAAMGLSGWLTDLLMLRCDPGLDPGEPRSTHRRSALHRQGASFEARYARTSG